MNHRHLGKSGLLVSEIAYGWGFQDMTHFGRRFKRAYGAAPKDYREIAGGSDRVRQARHDDPV